MNINPNWNRWIFASVTTYFKNIITNPPNSLPFIINSQNANIQGDSIELRVVGPVWRQYESNVFYGEITLNALIKATKDASDYHKIYRMAGVVESTFSPAIPVIKYGNGPADDNVTVIGCLILKPVDNKDIETYNFGQVTPEIPLLQTTVQGVYRIDLTVINGNYQP